MKKSFLSLLVLGASVVLPGTQAVAQVQRFDPVETRKILEAVRDNTFVPELRIVGEFKSEQAKKFVEFYQKKIRPKSIEMKPCLSKINGLRILIDNGGYKDETELELWKQQMAECYAKYNEMETDEAWTATLKEWSDLSTGLSGNLADEARKDYKDRMLWVFAPEQQGILNELDNKDTEYGLAISQAEANKDLAAISTSTSDAYRLFKSGEITFAEATKTLRENYIKGGSRVVGYQAVQALPEHLNRMAVIRAELAKSKGYKNWAEFILKNDDGYQEDYRGVEKQLSFLYELTAKLAPPVQALVDNRIKELGLTKDEVDPLYEGLVYPQGLGHLRLHFPADKITDIWEETMYESGFQNRDMSSILVDDRVRENKNATSMYQATIKSRYTEVYQINAETLDYVIEPKDSPKWLPGLSYILQTYKAGGVGDMGTMFHEGGHALERNMKFKNFDRPEAYAYVETPSTTMEQFMSDPEVIYAKMVEVDGKKPSKEEVIRLTENSNMMSAVSLLYTVTSSIFDIELWNYDYSAPGAETFMQRLEMLSEKTRKLVNPRDSVVKSSVPDFYGQVASMHYYSGAVRNIGYVFAELSSRQMITYFSDELEKATGRRDWLKQPMLAELFGERFFAEGWKQPFPQNIETITGRKFDASDLVDQILSSLPKSEPASQSDCESELKSPKK